MTPYLTTRSVGSESGESTGLGFGFTYLFKYAERGIVALGRTLSRVTLGDSSQSAESFIRFFIGMYIV